MGPKNDELIRSDLNLEKWSIFTTQHHRGLRVLKRVNTQPDGVKVTQRVTIGLEGSTETLTTEEGKIFYVLLDLWDQNGRPENGVIFASLNKTFNALAQRDPSNKMLRYGRWSKDWLRKKLRRMLRVPIFFELAYKTKDGKLLEQESFTLLSSTSIYERKIDPHQGYFDFSNFTIHPTIVKSILEKNIKPVRLDVLLKLKKEIALILYRFLDLILFDKIHYERDVVELAGELNFGAVRRDKLVSQVRAACAELEGKDLSHGRIAFCRVEKRIGAGWKIVVKKGRQGIGLKPPTMPQDAIEFPAYDNAVAALQALPVAQQEAVTALQKDIASKSSYPGPITDQHALIAAIKEFQEKNP